MTQSSARLLAFALGALLLGTACTRSAAGYYGTTEPKHGPHEVWSNLSTEPEYIDPGMTAEAAGGTVVINLFAGLTQPHPVSLEPMPDIAQSWDVSPEGTRYTFHLRPSVWSDGTPLTAADFVYAWRRVLNADTASKYASFLYPLRYAEMFNRRAILVRGVGATDEASLRVKLEAIAPLEVLRMAPELDGAFAIVGGDEAERPRSRERMLHELSGQRQLGASLRAELVSETLVGVRAADDFTLIVELENPLPYFLHIVKFQTAMPVPRHVIERLAKQGKSKDLWTRPENIVSNGAYKIESAKFRQYLNLVKNPRYWDAAHVKIDRVRLALIESYNTTLNMYEAGELDSIGSGASLPAEFMGLLSTQKDFHRAPTLATYFYWINVAAPPFDDVRVRNALRFAIDRRALIDHVARAGQIPTADLVPKGVGGYPGIDSPVFDPERARQWLREAGYGSQHPLPKITLTYNTSEGHKQLAEAVQAMWRKQLGIEVEIENQEWKVFMKTLQTHSFQIARMGWVGDYPDPNTFLEILSTQSGNNHSNWHNADFDALLARANATSDSAARMQLLQQAERIAMDAAPIIPIYVYTRSELLKPYVMGHTINYENRHLFKYWWIDERWYRGVPNTRLSDGFPPSPLAAAGSAEPGSALMFNFVVRRLLGLIPTLLVIVLVSFFVIRLAPGSPFATERGIPPEVLVELKAKYGFDRPMHEQLLRYLGGLCRGELGLSTKYPQRTVNEIIADGFPATLLLGTAALVWALLLGIGAGIIGAVRQNTAWDYSLMTIAMLGISLPTFVMGPLLVLMFALTFYALPPGGWGELRHVVLPSLTLGAYYAAYIARLTRGGMLEVVHADYVRMARAKGLSELLIVRRHMLRGGLSPVVTFLGPAIANLLVGSVVVEKIFATPGIGPYFVDAAFNRDYFLVMGIVVLDSAFLLVMNLLVDIAYGFMDPRIRYE